MLDWPPHCGRFQYWMQDHLEDAIKPRMILTIATNMCYTEAMPSTPCLPAHLVNHKSWFPILNEQYVKHLIMHNY